MDQRGKMKNKFKIVLNTDDVVHNRKILSVKLPVWKKLISVSCYEQTPISKVINKAITKYIEENNYDIETIKLGVDHKNISALNLYLKLGFKIIDKTKTGGYIMEAEVRELSNI